MSGTGETGGEQMIHQETIYRGKLLTVRKDRVRLENGRETAREVVVHPGAVAIVPLLPDGRVILVRQYRYAAGRSLLEIPAGTLDKPGESPAAAAARELAEETGYTATDYRELAAFFTAPGFCTERIYGLARRLARQEEADRFVVGAAALLHLLPMPDVIRALDVAAVPEEPRRAIGAALVALAEPGLRGDPLDHRVLRDAARLDRLGATGIAELLLATGVAGGEVYERLDPFAVLRDLAPDEWALDRLYARLLELPRRMETPTARTLAARRTGIMLFYLEALRDEFAEALPDAVLPETHWLVPGEES
jgi:ADP-ribose pyrophosphatase